VNWHRFKQYLIYRRKAIGRHGLHSPFLYQLVDECLLVKTGKSLPESIKSYLQDWNQYHIGDANVPQDWQGILSQISLQEPFFVFIENIHQSAKHSAHWASIVQKSEFQYSVDLFNYGLLFSNKKFKKKQHFFLKYEL
jgi:hypothetical protein